MYMGAIHIGNCPASLGKLSAQRGQERGSFRGEIWQIDMVKSCSWERKCGEWCPAEVGLLAGDATASLWGRTGAVSLHCHNYLGRCSKKMLFAQSLKARTSTAWSLAHWHQWESFHSSQWSLCQAREGDRWEKRQIGHHVFLSSGALHSQTVFNVTSAPELEIFVCVKWISVNNHRGLIATPGWVWEEQWRTGIMLDAPKIMNFFFSSMKQSQFGAEQVENKGKWDISMAVQSKQHPCTLAWWQESRGWGMMFRWQLKHRVIE